MYLVNDTVEESIYDLSVSRRLTHIARKEKGAEEQTSVVNNLTEAAIESANSLEVQESALAKMMAGGAFGGELVKKDDLWQCLFGNPNKAKEEVNGHSMGAEREVARFLRGEAAEQRRAESS